MEKALNKIYRFFYPALMPHQIRAKYRIPLSITVDVEIVDGYFVATCSELPGLITEGKDKLELLENFNNAVLSYYNVPKRDADFIFNRIDNERIVDGKSLVLA
ncbi:MAG: hypothetical protein KIH67_004605 [Candidatus Moranbacteria bacterium]|nr:hypothetical protein [Candidatus Moranbacteria bacterium]